MQPKVTLISPPQHVMETIWVLWEASKTDGDVQLDVDDVKRDIPTAKLEELFWQVLRQHIPVAEHIHFTFMLEGVSVSLREQMVRHRIGTHVGDNFGVDIIPDLATSSWWSQSMRIQDMGTFAKREMYRVPETLEGKTTDMGSSAAATYHNAMRNIEHAYNQLVKAGVPMEDARELIPLGAQHRISWDINLQALLHVLGKRGCWILQLGIWGPIIHGMVNELVAKVHPMFKRIVAPPCIDQDDNFKSCNYRLENARRITQEDQHPPCPLWLCRDETGNAVIDAKTGHHDEGWNKGAFGWYSNQLIAKDNLVPRHREMMKRAESYRDLWGHDPLLWEKAQ